MADKQYVVDYFNSLETSPEKKAEFDKDPNTAMKSNGLSDEDAAVMMSGDADRIREYLGDAAPDKISLAWA